MGIFDAQRETLFAANHVQVERTDGEMGRNLVVIRFGAKQLRPRGRASYKKVGRKSAGGRFQGNGFAIEMKNREMRGAAGYEMDPVVRGGAESIVSRLQPFEAGERKPAVRL